MGFVINVEGFCIRASICLSHVEFSVAPILTDGDVDSPTVPGNFSLVPYALALFKREFQPNIAIQTGRHCLLKRFERGIVIRFSHGSQCLRSLCNRSFFPLYAALARWRLGSCLTLTLKSSGRTKRSKGRARLFSTFSGRKKESLSDSGLFPAARDGNKLFSSAPRSCMPSFYTILTLFSKGENYQRCLINLGNLLNIFIVRSRGKRALNESFCICGQSETKNV